MEDGGVSDHLTHSPVTKMAKKNTLGSPLSGEERKAAIKAKLPPILSETEVNNGARLAVWSQQKYSSG